MDKETRARGREDEKTSRTRGRDDEEDEEDKEINTSGQGLEHKDEETKRTIGQERGQEIKVLTQWNQVPSNEKARSKEVEAYFINIC